MGRAPRSAWTRPCAAADQEPLSTFCSLAVNRRATQVRRNLNTLLRHWPFEARHAGPSHESLFVGPGRRSRH
jgi:hypothetical protein